MAENRIQFQRGVSLAEFLKSYGTEAQCEAAVVEMRWPKASGGYACPRCHCRRFALTFNGRRLWECLECRYQCSSIAGTVFQDTKLALTTWFLAIYFLSQNKQSISGLELKRLIGVGYRTAWMLKHKLTQTMCERESERRLSGRVEIDDAFLGGERPGRHGRGDPTKSGFVAAVATNRVGRPTHVRFDLVPDFSKASIASWAGRALAADATTLSDGWTGFHALSERGERSHSHQRYVCGHGPKAAQHPEFRWVNTLLSNLKTALSGTFHAFNHKKYGQRYLAEFAWRFNRRAHMPSMLPRLLHRAVRTKPWPEAMLRLSESRT